MRWGDGEEGTLELVLSSVWYPWTPYEGTITPQSLFVGYQSQRWDFCLSSKALQRPAFLHSLTDILEA